jgi:hypothetical protein
MRTLKKVAAKRMQAGMLEADPVWLKARRALVHKTVAAQKAVEQSIVDRLGVLAKAKGPNRNRFSNLLRLHLNSSAFTEEYEFMQLHEVTGKVLRFKPKEKIGLNESEQQIMQELLSKIEGL